jgi:hypothetical protein
MARKTQEEQRYDPLKDPKSVNFVQPHEVVTPIVATADGGAEVLDPMPAREVPSGK